MGYAGRTPSAGQTIGLAVGATHDPRRRQRDAAVVVLKVTATDATAAGYVTVWRCGTDRPLASSFNLAAGHHLA